MDSDWCTVCGKHVETPGQLYCNSVCRKKDQKSTYTHGPSPTHYSLVSLVEPFSNSLVGLRYHVNYHASKESSLKFESPFHLKLYKKSTAFRPVELHLFALHKKTPSIRSNGYLKGIVQ
ncbi:hypothetical protein K7432_000800 [Basidiobolus ranarum]|uniref:Uncharacterized protein n=1 Tax=Basidiobolus ranarum TaxID=34480 RepID=A0ABR2WAK5_9FUNG